jgi:peptidase A4-like protein
VPAVPAGAAAPGRRHYYAWLEWLGAKKTGINIHRIKRLGIHPGDQIHVYLSYAQSTHKLNFYIANNTTEKSQPVVFHNFNGARYYNGSTAEWVDERPTINGVPAHLKNFGTVNWSGIRAQENDGTWAKVGNLPHRRLHLTSNGKQLAAPGFLPNEGRAFQDNWIRCHG